MKNIEIVLNLRANTKEEIIKELAKEADKLGTISDLEAFIEDVITRENETSTGMGNGFGIPHTQSRHVTKPTVIFGRSQEVEWESIDGLPTTCYFLIAVPASAGGEHLKILQKLARNLMDENVQKQLKTGDRSEVESILEMMLNDGEKTVDNDEVTDSNNKLKIVAISNCPAGIAHTYMVAEGLERKANELGHQIKVETQGSSGVENRLSSKAIKEADYVILALGKTLTDTDRMRFAGKKVLHIKISEALKNLDTMFDDLENTTTVMDGSSVKLGKQEVEEDSIMQHLMAGVSAALPFVVGGGLLVAVANILMQLGMPYTDISQGASFTWVVEQIGYMGFTFMIPIMGAYIAYSIADKPAFAPAFVISYLANDKTLLQTEAGAGFLGAMVIGLSIGYFVRYFKMIKLPKPVQPLLTFTIIPFVTMFIFGVLTFYILGPFMGGIMGAMLSFLNNMPPQYQIPTAFLVGAMLAFDMGGPVNKTAWLFCFSLLDQGVYTWYGIVGVVALLPPVSAGISTYIRPSLFSKSERESALSAIIVGSTVATEPAIPFALSAPVAMISANVIAGGITGVATMLMGIERLAPGIGIFDPLLGLMTPWYSFYAVFIGGVALNVALIIIFRTIAFRRREEKHAS